MPDKALIRTLVEAWGPSGYEYQVRALIQKEVQNLADEIRTDAGGNLICRMGSGGKKIMIAAHMDEIGFIIHHIDPQGFARFSMIGGLFSSTLNGGRVKLENGMIGVIGLDGEPNPYRTGTATLGDFFLDFTGAGASERVQVGDVGAMWRSMDVQGSRVIAKSLDDRIGCVVAIEAMRRLKGAALSNTLYFVFTTQEEVGIRGARVSAFGIAPDMAIALDVTPTDDIPKARNASVKIGKGAAIKAMDAGHIVPPAVRDLMIKRAESAGIPYQIDVMTIGTTDAAAIQMTGSGIPSGAISIPSRYVHTTSEMVDLDDVEACVKLLIEVVEKPLEAV